MDKQKIVVTGSSGQLGNEIRVASASFKDFDVIFLSRNDLPIHQVDSLKEYFNSTKPAYCINCAAYTAVDKAETEKKMAFLINGEAAGALAAACASAGTKFIHISTDYVFNGQGTVPYTESDQVDPVNTYGASKLAGENLTFQHNPDAIVIRTSWVYSEFGNNFLKTMVRLMKEKQSLNVVNDQLGSPTYAGDLAEAILSIIRSGVWVPGIYHYSNEGIISWYDFAAAIQRATGSPCLVNPIPSSQFPTPAKRPGYSAFNKEKIKSTFTLDIPAWKDSMDKCLQKILTR